MEEAVKAWLALSPEDRLKRNTIYKADYESSFAFYGISEYTPWEELTHEQRQTVVDEFRRYQLELDSFAEIIRGNAEK